MESNFIDNVLEFYKNDDWKEILKLNKNRENQCALKLLWVWPSKENLKFIENVVKKFNLSGIISIGCGCGLFEYFLRKSTGLPVIGYEVNEEWWKSKYSNPTFIDIQFIKMPPKESALDPSHALLFCYFNNGPAFLEYINSYRGNMVIIIGPAEGIGRYTDPQPFSPNFGNSKWELVSFQEVKNTKDFIAVYIRCE